MRNSFVQSLKTTIVFVPRKMNYAQKNVRWFKVYQAKGREDLRKMKNREKKWGERLTKVLTEKKISQRKAAQISGVAPSVLDSWCKKGTSPTDLQAVKKLCDELDISFTWLLTGEYDKGEREPTITEIFDTVPYFDGLARIRIDRLVSKKGK
ncbi:MAG: hypothetical protein A4S09_14160 [Proteobacteria bacterium SG_bin7]|nr:MAG: hypothetical protein A4S09_14160 [Proteobacteria bacterium SG_bin7]